MQNYELVLVLNVWTSDKEREKLIQDFESGIEKNIIEKDEIWMLTTAYLLKWKKDFNKAYYVSYYLNAEPIDLLKIKESLLFNKGISRYTIFKMNKQQVFFHFEKLQSELNDIISSWDEKKTWQKVSFFMNLRNKKYINWKSFPMLKKYVTRFWDIKPRKYTKNSVVVQKALRTEIFRARELWVLEYIK